MLLGWHGTLLYLALSNDSSQCLAESSIIPWLSFDLLITVARLVKNPMQFAANRKVDQYV